MHFIIYNSQDEYAMHIPSGDKDLIHKCNGVMSMNIALFLEMENTMDSFSVFG